MSDFDIELPACFYLGQEYDLDSRKVLKDRPPVMYDARDLTTHGVVVGMTGSGKTGLCIGILEEAAIDGIPCIVLDLKGDLCNLLLQFPELAPSDFLKWLSHDEAHTKKKTPEEYAESLSELWRKGLTQTLQSPERIARLREAAEWAIYTPGSDAGLPLSILKNFTAPPPDTPRELLNQKIDATASALLGLTGVTSDPIQSREHILIAQILLHAWNRDESLDLKKLIRRIQEPPVSQVGAFEIDEFYPPEERKRLALSLNNILASPSFSTWIEGEPLDVGKMLHNGDKPRQVIFYLAHLSDDQRMFFVSLLLEEILSWTRKQPGSGTLRALLYIDEVFGYLPPHPKNPPSKLPLMTLMKQARAFGVGVLLATQNPVDLDYKALSNAGTWIIGKLQTERDKARLLDGLEGVAAERGTLTHRKHLEEVISSLGKRVFLLHDVHRPRPVLFQSRWALSYLRGPMTREQIGELMEPLKSARKAKSRKVEPPPLARAEDQTFRDQLRRRNVELPRYSTSEPELPAGVNPVYLPVKSWQPIRGDAPELAPNQDRPPPSAHEYPVRRVVLYQPRLFGFTEIRFIDRKRDLDFHRSYRLLAVPPENPDESVGWMQDEGLSGEIEDGPLPGAEWAEIPSGWDSTRRLNSLRRSLAEDLYQNARMRLFESPAMSLVSRAGEEVSVFLERLQTEAVRQAEAEAEQVYAEFRLKIDRLRKKLPTSVSVELPRAEASSYWDLPVLSWFRPEPTPPPPPPAPTTEEQAHARTRETIAQLEAEWVQRRAEVYAKWNELGTQYEEITLKPRRDDVNVVRHGLAWVPFWHCTYADGRVELLPAYGSSSPQA